MLTPCSVPPMLSYHRVEGLERVPRELRGKPVFIALYWVLLASIELRHAPWLGWIHDLSAPDPYFILPVIYAVDGRHDRPGGVRAYRQDRLAGVTRCERLALRTEVGCATSTT